MDNNILPKIDLDILQEKANEAAMKGAIECINNFYNGYNSPYKKAIEEELKSKSLMNGGNIILPDILVRINEQLSAEIDRIANQAIAKTYIPLVTKFLTGVDREVKFSDILKKFKDTFEDGEYEDFGV